MEHIGHRGAKRELPENTVPAFQRAFARGADAIELDVHATRDGVVVVHHDPDLHRKPPGAKTRAIADLDWAEVGRMELSPGIHLPALTAVLETTPSDKTVYVEIKGSGIESVVASVLAGSRVHCAVHSFDHGAVARMRELAPDLPRGILFDRLPRDVVTAMQAVGARDVWPDWRLIDEALVGAVHGQGGRVIAWTVNARDAAERLKGLGVDGVCTDDVRLLEGL